MTTPMTAQGQQYALENLNRAKSYVTAILENTPVKNELFEALGGNEYLTTAELLEQIAGLVGSTINLVSGN